MSHRQQQQQQQQQQQNQRLPITHNSLSDMEGYNTKIIPSQQSQHSYLQPYNNVFDRVEVE